MDEQQAVEKLARKLKEYAEGRARDVARGTETPRLAALLVQKYGTGIADAVSTIFPRAAESIMKVVDEEVAKLDPAGLARACADALGGSPRGRRLSWKVKRSELGVFRSLAESPSARPPRPRLDLRLPGRFSPAFIRDSEVRAGIAPMSGRPGWRCATSSAPLATYTSQAQNAQKRRAHGSSSLDREPD